MTLRSALRFVARNVVLGLALLAAVATSAVLTMRVVLSVRDVAVPALVGRSLREAGSMAQRRGLEVRVEGRRHDAEVAAGNILVQEPPPGATLKAHRSVRVWVSLGSRRVNVPPVEGQSARTARIALEQAGLPVTHVVEVAAGTPEGTVLVQRPPPGETDTAETEASLLVSRGPGRGGFVMPDLIGRAADPVISSLRAAGFKVTDVRYRSYPGVAPGIVLRQLPPAGYPVSRRTPLSLDVSRAES